MKGIHVSNNKIKKKAFSLLRRYYLFSPDRIINVPFFCTSIELLHPDNNLYIIGNNNDLSLHLLNPSKGTISEWLRLSPFINNYITMDSKSVEIFSISKYKNNILLCLSIISEIRELIEDSGTKQYYLFHGFQ